MAEVKYKMAKYRQGNVLYCIGIPSISVMERVLGYFDLIFLIVSIVFSFYFIKSLLMFLKKKPIGFNLTILISIFIFTIVSYFVMTALFRQSQIYFVGYWILAVMFWLMFWSYKIIGLPKFFKILVLILAIVMTVLSPIVTAGVMIKGITPLTTKLVEDQGIIPLGRDNLPLLGGCGGGGSGGLF